MAMTSREVMIRSICFQTPDRMPYTLPSEFGSDATHIGMSPSPDARPKSGIDEWGCLWHNIGVSHLGEVKEFPLKSWADWPNLAIPDIRDPKRWQTLDGARDRAGDKFLICEGLSLYERAHFLRSLENLWMDINIARDELEKLLDVFVDMNLYAIEKYALAGADALHWCDDWGLQNQLMISPDSWREIWKPRYARVYQAARAAGMLTILHSCGDISSILEDLLEAGLNVIQMDQQENMGLEKLGRQFGGRLAFWCPADIQTVMAHSSVDEIKAYCRRMARTLGSRNGGFIAKYYSDPVGAGHRPEAVQAMCEEFTRISRNFAVAFKE